MRTQQYIQLNTGAKEIQQLKIVSMIRKYHNHKPQTTPCTVRKRRSTITSHQGDILSKAISSLFPIKMIAILEGT